MIDRAKEWLESLYRSNHPYADMAIEILDAIQDADWGENLIGNMLDGNPTGDEDADDMVKRLAEHEALEALIDEQESADFEGATPVEKLKAGLIGAQARADDYWDVRELLMNAGVLRPGDRDTDILPMLRMFIPS